MAKRTAKELLTELKENTQDEELQDELKLSVEDFIKRHGDECLMVFARINVTLELKEFLMNDANGWNGN